MSWKPIVAAVAAAAAIVVVVVLIVGADDSADAEQTDGAFIAEMIPHHESAVEMSEIALERAQHAEIKDLAKQIIDSQSAEIEQLRRIHERLFGEPVEEADHGTLGLPAHEAGMEADMSELEEAKPFDEAFIDMMIPHHQGAIRMARIVIEQGNDAELATLAESIIDAQSSEISLMNQWRVDWYGAPSPAGGIPPLEEGEVPSHEEMGH
jgi:uncharacterized protein (DUF305 family)